jgi:hypothetical protein
MEVERRGETETEGERVEKKAWGSQKKNTKGRRN